MNGARHALTPGWRRWSLVCGLFVVILGLQLLIYERTVASLARQAGQQLEALRLEATDNREANAALRALQAVYDASTDAERRRELLALRDRVTERFAMARQQAIADFIDTVRSLPGDTAGAEFGVLERQTDRLEAVYSNLSEKALAFATSPPLYLLPGALLAGGERDAVLSYNVAVQDLLVGDTALAIERLAGLRTLPGQTPGELARVDYALARAHLQRFFAAGEPDGLGQSLSLVSESLRREPGDSLSTLLIDYLLAVDNPAKLVDMETLEGRGSGRADGERGALSSGASEF